MEDQDVFKFPDLSKEKTEEISDFNLEVPFKHRLKIMFLWDGLFLFIGLFMYYYPVTHLRFLSYFVFIFGFLGGFVFLFYKKIKLGYKR